MSSPLTTLFGGLGLAAIAQLTAAGVWAGPAARPAPRTLAIALITDPTGHATGAVKLIQTHDGLLHIQIRVIGLAPGLHGIHFHSVGRCEGPAFATAGGHVNPGGMAHGLVNPAGAHAGDLPNIAVGPSGEGTMVETVRRAWLSGQGGLMDGDGTAVIVHAGTDDEMTDPAGNSGPRIGCGVLHWPAA